MRQAGERLTEDSRLRDALTDEQAQQLFDWGLAQIQVTVESTLDLADEPAGRQLDAQVTKVRRVMRQVNQMVENWESSDPAGHWQDLWELSQTLRPWQQPAGAWEATPELFTLGQSETPLDKDTLFTRLMDIIK